MGIKNLSIILNKMCKCAINQRKLNVYSGMIIGIDLSIFLYKYLYNNDDHIEGLTRLILRLLKNGITPVFIIDGRPPKEKNEILQNRKERKIFLNTKKEIIDYSIKLSKDNYDNFKDGISNYIKEINQEYVISDDEIRDLFSKGNDELIVESDKISKKIIYVTAAHIENAKKLFDLFGVGYIVAPSEAESLLASLCKSRFIDACISEDTDILANGGLLFLRNFNADKNYVDEYCLEGILDNLKLNYDEFIDFCILCGCDYTAKINGLGPINALKLIHKYKNLETIISEIKLGNKYVIPDNFDYVKARELFLNPIDIRIVENIKNITKMREPNLNGLNDFLKDTKLKHTYLKEININLMNYYLNIV